MSGTIATEEAVRTAVQEILRDPTLTLTNGTVIQKLGGGSKSTIAPMVWKLREELALGGPTKEPVPSHLAAEANALVARLHAAAMNEARREYEADIMRMGRILAGLQADLDATLVQADAAEAKAAQLEADLAAARRVIEELRAEIQTLQDARILLDANARTARQDLDRANEAIASMKARAEEASRIEQRLSRIEAAMPKTKVSAQL